MTPPPRPAHRGGTAARVAAHVILGVVGAAVSCVCLFGPMLRSTEPSPLELAAWWSGAAAGVAVPVGAGALLFPHRRWTVVPAMALLMVLVVAVVVGYGVSVSRAVPSPLP